MYRRQGPRTARCTAKASAERIPMILPLFSKQDERAGRKDTYVERSASRADGRDTLHQHFPLVVPKELAGINWVRAGYTWCMTTRSIVPSVSAGVLAWPAHLSSAS